MRLPLVPGIDSRDGTSVKDEHLTNVLKETDGGGELACVRPGLRECDFLPSMSGKGMVSFNDTLISCYGSTLYRAPSSFNIDEYYTVVGTGPLTYIVTNGSNYVVTEGFPNFKIWFSLDGLDWTSASIPVVTNLQSMSQANGLFLVVATISGVRHVLTSPTGAVWTNVGASNLAGTVAKFVYIGGNYLAFISDDVYSSNDLITWTLIAASAPTSTVHARNRIATDGTTIVVVTEGKIYSSTDGVAWTLRYTETGSFIGSNGYIRQGLGKFWVLFSEIAPNSLAVSTDGESWAINQLPVTGEPYRGLAISNDRVYLWPTNYAYMFYTTSGGIFIRIDGAPSGLIDDFVWNSTTKAFIDAGVPSSTDIGDFQPSVQEEIYTQLNGDFFDFAQSTL
jgi:hypothetical protein